MPALRVYPKGTAVLPHQRLAALGYWEKEKVGVEDPMAQPALESTDDFLDRIQVMPLLSIVHFRCVILFWAASAAARDPSAQPVEPALESTDDFLARVQVTTFLPRSQCSPCFRQSKQHVSRGCCAARVVKRVAAKHWRLCHAQAGSMLLRVAMFSQITDS